MSQYDYNAVVRHTNYLFKWNAAAKRHLSEELAAGNIEECDYEDKMAELNKREDSILWFGQEAFING